MEIVAVNFTWALTGGMRVRRACGDQEWMSFLELQIEVGVEETMRLRAIAYHNGMTGMWYNALSGKNCYANGELVNP